MEWKYVEVDENVVNYEVSSCGQVRNKTTKKILKQSTLAGGYMRSNLWIAGKLRPVVTHLLVARAYLSNLQELPVVNHKNYDRANNCVANLEWTTVSANILHSYRKPGRKVLARKLKSEPEGIVIPECPGYLATREGEIYSSKTHALLTKDPSRGYFVVSITREGKESKKYVHKLIASAYHDNIEQKQMVNHIDGNKHNNCVDNLEWVTAHENAQHAVSTNLKPSKGGVDQLTLTGVVVDTHATLNAASTHIGIAKSAVSRCCLGKQKTCGGYKWRYRSQK
jgi:hypothetical protein